MSDNNSFESAHVDHRAGSPSTQREAERPRRGSTVGPENHLALVYETPAEQLSAVIPFVRQGLDRNERVMYIADENPPAALRASFREAGIDVDAALDSGALTFHSPAETYSESGSFGAEEMIAFLDETTREAVASDEYDRLRITGEMTWALGAETETLDCLVEYEARLNEFYPDKPVIGLCQYDRTRFPPDLLHDIIRSHPHQVYNATVTQNFAYLPPEEFFGAEPPSADTEAFIEAHLDRIRAHSRREEHERTLSALSTSSYDLLEGDTEGVVDRVVETVERVLSPAVVEVFVYEDATDQLRPMSARLSGDGTADSATLPDECHDLVRETFVENRSNVFSNARTVSEPPSESGVLQSGVAYPLDRHGVLFVGSARAHAFDEHDVEFVRTIAHTAQAALERTEQERTLKRQNEQLRHLDRVNRTIRHIDQALVRASSREGIETVVCDRLAATDVYQFVWIGDRDPLTDGFVPRHWAGDGEPYLDELLTRGGTDESSRDDDDVVPCPARSALESRTAQFVPNALTTTGFDTWRRVALGNGLYSVLSVPLVHDDAEYGVLSVYAGEPNAMTEMEREVLQELGATVAYAIDAAETKESLHTDRLTEVRLDVRDARSPLLRLAQTVDGTLDVQTILPDSAGKLRLFFTVSDAPVDGVLSAAEGATNVETIRRIADHGQGALFEAVLGVSSSIPRTMAEHNGSVMRLVAAPNGVDLTVELPQVVDVREFVERFQEDYPETTVSSIRRVARPLQTRETFYSAVEDRLTDRQLEALRLAYHSGYFEWPRDSSATEVAESMGVTQPTFNGHLRAGERKLFELLFDP